MLRKISLPSAILININIIIGAGIFLNISPIAQLAGPLGFLGYALGACILLPFVFSLAKLAQANPQAGGLYIYNKTYLSSFAGFFSGWAYFIGKTVSAAFLAYAFTRFFHAHLLPQYNPLILASLVILTLTIIHILGLRLGGSIQFVFLFSKIVPLLFAIVFGTLMICPHNLVMPLTLKPLIAIVPLTLYTLMGFEITCSIGHLIKKPTKNIFWAIMASFLIVACIYILFQMILYGALGQALIGHPEPLTMLSQYPLLGKTITSLIFASVISGSFGILTSNCWNLHTLATDGYAPKILTTTWRHVPVISILVEACIACIILVISKNQVALQSMSVFGVVLAFLLSAISAYKATRKKQIAMHTVIPLLAIFSCLYALFVCLQKMQLHGVSFPYLALLVGGIAYGILIRQR